MPKSSFVLRVLGILVPEEILKLSEVVRHKENSLKKVAGEELVVWDEAPTPPSRSKKTKLAKILPFPKDFLEHLVPEDEGTEISDRDQSPTETYDETELILRQREINRHLDENSHKLDAVKGYKTSTDTYLVKSSGNEIANEHRFASTTGVLVNKKIA